jgi:hypothetical protein
MRAAILTAPDSVPLCAEFPDPEPLPGHDLLELVGAGLHQVVRSLATGRHYGSSHAYPLVPGVDAVARTADGRLVYTGWPRAPWGTVAERLSTPVGIELPVGADPLDWLATTGAVAVSLADDAALANALADAPDLVLDYVWGPVAEAAFAALGRRGLGDDTADISYVQIGAVAGSDAAVPATLLRSRRIRISGSGAGSVSTERMIAELPKVAALIADGTLDAPYTTYPLDRIGEAWAHAGRDRAVVTPR